ncbi:MAG: DUF3883 domain-containing protein [Candidatus Omnitrophica bacterium]|nr:DUF3883 domain-containing protein [Candidatus Omnitrophota bacterium]MCM8833140.1 DUF3883 domain-containing protein [Candidatus Omnitrophota bacterium]
MIKSGQFLQGPFWIETVRVVSVSPVGDSQLKIEAVGENTKTFYSSIFSDDDLKKINVIEKQNLSFDGNGNFLFLYLESLRIRNAYQFDPLYAVNISQVDPLPHQIEAVYHYIMKNPKIRFLLADDPGAGKTIMAGLLLKELKYRGLVERTLIVVPGHLKDQWLREMKEKFHEKFSIIDRNVMNSEWGKNIFKEKNQVIISMDFAKQDDVMNALQDTHWDFCIVDEAHKMSAFKYGKKINKTQRYSFGELISTHSSHLLFLTATPHRGDPENFRLLLELLSPSFFANTSLLNDAIKNKENPLFLRRLKEDLKDFENAPLFPPRKVDTIKYFLSEDEKELYNSVTKYVEEHYNKALSENKKNVAFALTILQRRLASSVCAVRKSLERRYKRLYEICQKWIQLQDRAFLEFDYDEEYLIDLEERELWIKEEELLEKLTAADTIDELKNEIANLEKLVVLAKEVEKKEIETKLNELKRVMENEELQRTGTKLLIFTESKDTLDYLVEKLRKWGYSVTFIHGGMNLTQRINAENEFKSRVQVMVSTEAGGEGINLQFCWLMVNYDIPWNPNRLEQRMGRIHRYGQRHEVHIYNLVASETIEGEILLRLLYKLNNISKHLGSDKVFDVIGEILGGKNLSDLIMDAISNRKTMDDILADFDKIPDEEAIKKVKEASLEALATRHINLSKILGEQRKAKENKLVPEYVEEFFKKAAGVLNISLEKRKDGLWRISHIPNDIRKLSYDFKIKFGEVQKEYKKFSFDKEKAFKFEAEFVAMGHPLLEAVIEKILTTCEEDANKGATFIDLEGKKDGLIWFVEAEIKDGKNETAGKRIFAVYQDKNNNYFEINPAILWDLKPEKIIIQKNVLKIDKDDIISYIINEGLDVYKKELMDMRNKQAAIKRKYGIRSLETLILESESKLADFETRRLLGYNIPEVNIQSELRRKEDLFNKKEQLERELEAETHLYITEPKILSVIYVVPAKKDLEMVSDEEIEKIGMQVALEYELKNKRIPEDVSLKNLGYDIRSKDGERVRYIEVKARVKEGNIVLTPNEWLMAQRLKDEYWLYVVTNASSNPQLYTIQNPAEKLEPHQIVDIVRYVITDWKDKVSLNNDSE